jgi:hypothetical protein
MAELIEPYVTGDTGKTAFNSAVEGLIDRIYERFKAATTFLADRS